MNALKSLLLVLLAIMLLPFVTAAFIAGLIMCGLRGGYACAHEMTAWLTR